MAASTSQAAFAVNFPDGRCASGPALRSAMTVSTMACPRCWDSACSIVIGESVNTPWWRQVSNSGSCPEQCPVRGGQPAPVFPSCAT